MTPHVCPVCRGTGLVSVPPGVAGDLPSSSGTSIGPWPCRPCAGTGVLWEFMALSFLRGEADALQRRGDPPVEPSL